ncbi:MAG: hypothetical protein AB7S38_15260 [Vulcanimicrobiota bacterium]
MSELEAYLARLSAGDSLEPGRFTIDLERARRQLREHRSAEPAFYLLKVFQALVAGGALRIDLHLNFAGVRMAAEVDAGSLLTDQAELMRAISEPDPHGALRHLAIGLDACASQSVGWGVWTDRWGWSLSLREDQLETQQLTAQPSWAKEGHWVEFRLQRRSLGSLAGLLSERKAVSDRCQYCPVPVRLDDVELPSGWRVPEGDEDFPGFHLAERYLCEPRGPVGMTVREDLALVTQREAIQPREAATTYQIQLVGAQRGGRLRCRMALALPHPQKGSDRLTAVKAGVTTMPHTIAAEGRGLEVVVEGDHLTTDLSEFGLVEDEALAETVAEAARQAVAMIDELQDALGQLPRHYHSDAPVFITLNLSLGVLFPLLIPVGLGEWIYSRRRQARIERETPDYRLRVGSELERTREHLKKLVAPG